MTTRASAVVVAPDEAEGCPVAALITPNPYLVYARIASLFHPQAAGVAGNSPECRGGGQRADCGVGRGRVRWR